MTWIGGLALLVPILWIIFDVDAAIGAAIGWTILSVFVMPRPRNRRLVGNYEWKPPT